jgi:ATP-dependent DNA ligase
LAAVEGSGWQLWGRERADYTARYPELDVLRRLPAGTLVDGELVALDAEGRPDLRALLRRHGLADLWRIRQARQWCPVRYVVFDLLYYRRCCLLRELAVSRGDGIDWAYVINTRDWPPSTSPTLDELGNSITHLLDTTPIT